MTTTDVARRPSAARDECFDSLADANRRAVVRIVHERSPSGITKDALVSAFVTVISNRDAGEDENERSRAHTACHHRLIPALTDAGLLEVTDDELVRTTDHWAFDDAGIESVITGQTDASSDELDAVFGALADPRRRRALSILKHQYQPTAVDDLAANIATVEANDTERSRDTVDRLRTSLVHADLPRLSEANLVAYDSESKRVSYEGHPLLRADWLGDTLSIGGESSSLPRAASASRG